MQTHSLVLGTSIVYHQQRTERTEVGGHLLPIDVRHDGQGVVWMCSSLITILFNVWLLSSFFSLKSFSHQSSSPHLSIVEWRRLWKTATTKSVVLIDYIRACWSSRQVLVKRSFLCTSSTSLTGKKHTLLTNSANQPVFVLDVCSNRWTFLFHSAVDHVYAYDDRRKVISRLC